MIGPRERPGLLDLGFASVEDEEFYLHGSSIKSRVRQLYGKQTHMAVLVQPMCLYRPWVVDYFEQFPALPLWIAQDIRSPHQVGPKQRELIQRLVVDLFDVRPKLKDLMRRWSIPQPFRKLKGQALLPRHSVTLRRLSAFNPSLVSQAIPESHKAQRRWLNTMAYVLGRALSAETTTWFIRASTGRDAAEIGDMIDFCIRGDGFDIRWSWGQAATARERWHERLARQRTNLRYGVEPDEIICDGPVPDTVAIDGYEFHLLRTPAAIQGEGAAMHHCVGSYVRDVLDGGCWIVGMTEAGRRVATLEMSPVGHCRQLRGPCNATTFMMGVRAAVTRYELQFAHALERIPA